MYGTQESRIYFFYWFCTYWHCPQKNIPTYVLCLPINLSFLNISIVLTSPIWYMEKILHVYFNLINTDIAHISSLGGTVHEIVIIYPLPYILQNDTASLQESITFELAPQMPLHGLSHPSTHWQIPVLTWRDQGRGHASPVTTTFPRAGHLEVCLNNSWLLLY